METKDTLHWWKIVGQNRFSIKETSLPEGNPPTLTICHFIYENWHLELSLRV